tara:strand:+ start:1745 stop:2146 length:402 start_codon:yes stop_codon:yes gene_type:complete
MGVYEPDNYQARVDFAAGYISGGRETTRAFDTCFEMYDGCAVALKIYRRAQKNPQSKMAQNLYRYLCRESLGELADKYAHIPDNKISNLAAQLRYDATRPKVQTELTPAGEQHVIPGCERNASPKASQLDLFG